MKKLVIVESPAKAKTIEKFLGTSYKVVASVGHIRDLPKSKMGIDIENNFEPSYINIRGKGELIKSLKAEAKKSSGVLLATDPDREGEAIAWHLCHILGLEVDSKSRVVFREITKEAIKNAIVSPREIDTNLVDAQQARRVLDRLVGYSLSPILWRKVKKGLSAGRVQSVANKLICDREKEIRAFSPEEYWTLEANCKKTSKQSIKFEYAKATKEFINENDIEKVYEDCNGQKLIVIEKEEKVVTRNAPSPFTTSTLQQDAANKLGFQTKKTMMLAQQLYEGIKIGSRGIIGLITYMRTDSTRISDSAKFQCRSLIEEKFGKEYLGFGGKAGKGAQDAHEAIRPTYVDLTPYEASEFLTKDQFKLYELIWNRFVASQMSAAKYNTSTITGEVSGHIFKAKGSSIAFDGYQRVYSSQSRTDEILPDVEKGEELEIKSLKKEQHFTQAPPRFTEASLVKEMEELGIGRPSTYAPTIATILSRGYVAREKKSLLPTELGFIIDEIMSNYFSEVINAKFTANMENEFDNIENGTEPWKTVISDFYDKFNPLLMAAETNMERVDLAEQTDLDCPKCGRKLVIRSGKFGKFYACTGYPECDYTKPILNSTGIRCPKCGEGEIVERKTKKLKPFYGCSNFPTCNFSTWDKPIEKFCSQCNSIMVVNKFKKEVCSNRECSTNNETVKTTKSAKQSDDEKITKTTKKVNLNETAKTTDVVKKSAGVIKTSKETKSVKVADDSKISKTVKIAKAKKTTESSKANKTTTKAPKNTSK